MSVGGFTAAHGANQAKQERKGGAGVTYRYRARVNAEALEREVYPVWISRRRWFWLRLKQWADRVFYRKH